MNPIEKAQAKSAALKALGLGTQARPGDIRAAWRRIAFETHPDRNGGALDAFVRARAAYDLLADPEDRVSGSGSTRVRPARPANMGPRPKASGRTTDISRETHDKCRALLEEDDHEMPRSARHKVTDHIPVAVHSQGRSLTYVVPTPLTEGTNRVALPTAILVDPRKDKPQIVTISSSGTGPGIVDIPETTCQRLFPGARSVHIRFAKDDA